jgi:hypothetical protein
MNYATLLALLAALSFGLPLLVQLGERAGVSRGSGIALTLAFILFGIIWAFLRAPLREEASKQNEVQTNSPDSE